MNRFRPVWTVITLPAAMVAAPALGLAFTFRNLLVAGRVGLRQAVVGVLNLPFDFVTNTIGFFAFAGFYPAFAGGPEDPAVGVRGGSLIFLGGPLGAAVNRIASGFTPTSTVFVSRRAWDRLSPDKRDRLINHELWHAQQQFLRYSGWIFWPAYLASNVIWGAHHRNPFESGRRGAYRNVDDRWDSGYRESALYLECSDPCWRRRG